MAVLPCAAARGATRRGVRTANRNRRTRTNRNRNDGVRLASLPVYLRVVASKDSASVVSGIHAWVSSLRTDGNAK
jgi:sulfur relay (sulfurtransferase) complex TusBCD TusD component (DsrE family)